MTMSNRAATAACQGLALLGLSVAAAWAAGAGFDAARSTVVATFRQEGVPVDAPFHKLGGTIRFDAAHPEAGSAALDVDTTSFDIGDAAYNAEVAKPAWLDSAKHPVASFRSTALRQLAPGHLEATGTLTLKGRALPLTVPVTQAGSGAAATFDGSFKLSRKAFAIGDASWDDVLEDGVVVKFHLVGAAP